MPDKIITTWTQRGVRYFSVQRNNGFAVIDENGKWFGVWLDVETFKRKITKHDPDSVAIGKAELWIMHQRA